jgi:thioredoxin 1
MEYGTPIVITQTTEIDPLEHHLEPLEQKIITIRIGGINHIESIEQRKAMIRDSRILVIKYGAEWCGPCKKSKPGFLEMANKESDTDCVYASEDIDDEHGELPESIRTIPAFHIYKGGEFERSITGSDLKNVSDVLTMLKR